MLDFASNSHYGPDLLSVAVAAVLPATSVTQGSGWIGGRVQQLLRFLGYLHV